VDAAQVAPVVGEGAVAETNVGQDVTADAAVDGEAVAKADGTVAAVVEPDPAPAETPTDPIAKAAAALDKIDAAVASVAKPDDLEKSMYHVGRFAEFLEGLSYLAAGAQSETDFEGDNSPVPAKLRDWLKAGATIFKDMAKEEVDEFVAGFKAQKTAATGDLAKGDPADGADGDDLAKTITDLTAERNTLAQTVADKDDALAKLADRIEPLAQSFEALAKRLAVVEASPAPAKTAGPLAAISKEQDAGGAAALEKATPSPDDIASALGAMTEEDRALLLIKASHQLPRAVRYR
jgi:hypothetical protein